MTWEQTAIWLPVSIGEQKYHWLLSRAGCSTYAPFEPAEDQAAALQEATMPAGFMQASPELEAAFARFGFDAPAET